MEVEASTRSRVNVDTTATTDNVISANAILSLAKDERYVEECRNLISKIMGWLHPSLEGDITTSWLFAATLFSYFAQRGKGSVGMKAVGLVAEGTSHSSSIRSTMATTIALATASAISFYWSRRRLQENTTLDFMHGNHRLNAFELQRQRMIQRATQQPTQGQPQHHSHQLENSETPTAHRMLQRVKNQCKTCIDSCIQALSSCAARGPHDRMAVGPFSVGEWLLRLRLAYYCLGGRSAFWLPGSNMALFSSTTSGGGGKSDPRVQTDPSIERTLRLCGILILSHAVGEGLKRGCRAWIQARVRRKIEQDISMTETRHHATIDLTSTSRQDDKNILPCFICQEPRVTPACSVKCGHVFCWQCLQLWIASKKECPVCRTPCRPQDVAQLQNYHPTTKV